ncbi:isopenicillin N synthase family dioxygenase [Streptomyces sp. NRRL S-1448]|uniref:isopenicillin N synthase family dioxygenase n=1 Tax=Streptomyces sp. NRRL S-1448 TaxID=1463883 RepID=UPI0004C0F6EA|nr:2-oxoglutarate and iron-dependent oxygenase domain-containing protein [Streptomyces sp. NRRL S-1448]
MATSPIPTIDLTSWTTNSPQERRQLAAHIDQSLQTTGFLLVTGHGIDFALPTRVRQAAHDFFHLPPAVKKRYAQNAGQEGWIGRGQVTTAHSEGTDTPPDLLEVWAAAANSTTHPPITQPETAHPNTTHPHTTHHVPDIWPDEVPALRGLVAQYTERMRTLADTLLEAMASALRQPADFFTRHTARPNWAFNINWYPAARETGAAAPGQFRIGPHTDFGLITILDRQTGQGGLQVHDDKDGWQDAPYEPGAFTLNIGDLMARWSGGRWHSGRHRVLPPPADAPGEELTSLVYFHACDPHTRITPLQAPLGRTPYDPVIAGDYIRDKLQAITAGHGRK